MLRAWGEQSAGPPTARAQALAEMVRTYCRYPPFSGWRLIAAAHIFPPFPQLPLSRRPDHTSDELASNYLHALCCAWLTLRVTLPQFESACVGGGATTSDLIAERWAKLSVNWCAIAVLRSDYCPLRPAMGLAAVGALL